MSRKQDKPVPVNILYDEVLAVTDKALLLQFDTREEWIPKSKIYLAQYLLPEKFHGAGKLRVDRWIVDQKRLDDFVELKKPVKEIT